MVITPEDQHDYIQFSLGAQAWPSNDGSHCTVEAWDPSQGNPAVSVSFFSPLSRKTAEHLQRAY